MKKLSRRDLLKMGLAAPVTASAFANAPENFAPRKSSPAEPPQTAATPSPAGRERLLMDSNWRFHLGDADDPRKDFRFGLHSEFAKSGDLFVPSEENFDDRSWRAIHLPHDFAVALPFVNQPAGIIALGAKPLGRPYPATSIGWYRRTFDIPRSDLGRCISIEFDGVFRDCTVALNGFYLGRNMSGYAPFRYDITDFANYGGTNVLVVRVDATEHEGWFYEGAGIYRHVWLVKTNALHVAHWGTYITSERTPGAANLSIVTEISNQADAAKSCRVLSTIFDPAGGKVSSQASPREALPAHSRYHFTQMISVAHPAFWSIDEPHMYRLETVVESDGIALDRHETPFGIRTIRFDADGGFFLNGKRVEIKGTCNHQDHAGVGVALPDRIQYFRIAKLKEMGANAYRTSHNPPTPELLDACDRLGMLVMDETRMMSSSREGLSQLRRMLKRDRNHPSVILWSMGNEEPMQGTPRGARIVSAMKRLARRLDPSRPITAAMNRAWGKGISQVIDIQGFNYMHSGNIDQFHADFPAQPSVGSEEASTVSTRGIYANDKARGYVSAYDLNRPPWGALAEEWWKFYDVRPFLAGAFVWTGFDYRGEPTPYGWPCISSHFGLMDTCGFPKDNYFYYQTWWTSKPVLHLFPHWNWRGREGQEISVWVYANCHEVELFLNDKSLGRQSVARNSHLEWKVNFVPGTLLARGYRQGTQVLEARRETTGAPAAIHLVPDRARIYADGEDVSLVAVAVLDAQNRIVPVAENEITFTVSGPGKIIGVGNGDPSSHEADKASHRKVFNGLAQVIVQTEKAPGEILLGAASPGLRSAKLTIHAAAHPLRPAVA